MLFTDIRLQNYRSYVDASFELGSGVNIVVGPNAAGKTNLLEALMVCAVGKSYRARDPLLIRSGQLWLRLDVHTDNNQTRVVKIIPGPHHISDDSEVPGILGKSSLVEKSFEFDSKMYKRMTASHRQPVVLFQPEDLRLLYAEPLQRRDYIDDFLEQFEIGYYGLRVSLRRIIAQRNALLKQQAYGKSQMFAWNVRLCDVASKVVEKRIELLSQINKNVSEVYASISGKEMKVRLRYESKTPLDNYSSNLMKQLESQLEIDRIRGFTSRGPHRDDIVACFDDTPLSQSASRGENRTFMLSLKILELQILEEKTGKRPLLLLDDVFSELDGARRRALTQFLQNYQTIITTTDADVVLKHFSEKCTVIAIGE